MAKPKGPGTPGGNTGGGGTTGGGGHNNGGGHHGGGTPPKGHVPPASSITGAQHTTAQAVQQGKPPGAAAGGGGGGNKPPKPPMPPPPNNPPDPANIRHTDASREHILDGDGGSQGGHRAGTGLRNKTEFPKDWDDARILDAAHRVTQGQPTKGPYKVKDANGNQTWAYDYEGTVDGVQVKTIVLENGEIRTAFPARATDPGVIQNPGTPNPAPAGIPVGVAPRYSHPDLGGDGSWTWEGPKGKEVVRVVVDAQGNVTRTVLGPYKK